jgi:ABC-2 type transport system permease protein
VRCGAALVLAASSFPFSGIGAMTAVLPLISPEKGTQLAFIAQGLLLVVSGVYYPVSVLPEPMQWVAVISPATYTLEGIRDALLDGAGPAQVWGSIWPLLVIGVFAVPLGLEVFRRGERHAKRHGRLKRSG